MIDNICPLCEEIRQVDKHVSESFGSSGYYMAYITCGCGITSISKEMLEEQKIHLNFLKVVGK